MKFNVSIFADGDFEYRVDGYVIEAQAKFPSFSGILVEETA